MKHILIAAVVCLSAALPVRAEFITGNELFDQITSEDLGKRLLGLGYIVGVFDATQRVHHCPPSYVTPGQVREMAIAWMKAKPQERHQSADTILASMLKKMWPCKQETGRDSLNNV